MLTYFMAICNILKAFGIFYDHLVHIVFIWYIFQLWYHVPRKIWQPRRCLRQIVELQERPWFSDWYFLLPRIVSLFCHLSNSHSWLTSSKIKPLFARKKNPKTKYSRQPVIIFPKIYLHWNEKKNCFKTLRRNKRRFRDYNRTNRNLAEIPMYVHTYDAIFCYRNSENIRANHSLNLLSLR
jgi:hypothetical protein